MNEKLPYEEELSKRLQELPLPDGNVSWQDMKQRLDEDKDDGIIAPPVGKGCIGYSLLLIALSTVLFIIINYVKWPWIKNQKNIVSQGEVVKEQTLKKTVGTSVDRADKKLRPQVADTPGKNFKTTDPGSKNKLSKDSIKTTIKIDPKEKVFTHVVSSINADTKFLNTRKNKPSEINAANNGITKNKNQHLHKKIPATIISKIQGGVQQADSLQNEPDNSNGTNGVVSVNDHRKIDSIAKGKSDSSGITKKIKNAEAAPEKTKINSSEKALIYFAAGIALHQQLPINGQTLVPYNSLGRKSTLRDYIPSVYFRMYKDKKWFLQAEFRYGAPQYTRDLLYVQKKVVDTFTRSTLDTSTRLKKTYYHQLPVSFNYFVLPHLSIGAGFIWNKFNSAVTEQEIKRTSNITLADTVLTKTILKPKRADSNFAKSYFQALIEMHYQWKRLSFGARYSFGLQPYIRFQLPGGNNREEKNSSLGIFVRYDLWQSKKR
ncbi:MAG: hypothetical protein ABI416_11185 [Ginsengibacter sp.]